MAFQGALKPRTLDECMAWSPTYTRLKLWKKERIARSSRCLLRWWCLWAGGDGEEEGGRETVVAQEQEEAWAARP